MIRVDYDGYVATITLNRPAARNALPVAGWQALAEAAREIAGSDARVVLLRSEVPVIFSAGADIAVTVEHGKGVVVFEGTARARRGIGGRDVEWRLGRGDRCCAVPAGLRSDHFCVPALFFCAAA